MIKVLQIGFTDNYGGVEACIMNYYRNIDRTQIQFGFTDIRGNDIAYKDEIISLGGSVHKVKSWSSNPAKGMFALKKLINENGYDIVHFNMNSIANIFQFLAADQSNAKAWLIHAHNSGREIGKLKQLLQIINSKILVDKASRLCACSQKAAKWMYRNIPVDYNVHIINNAVNLQKLCFDIEKRGELRAKYKLENCFVIGHIGRFMLQKNHARLIDIFNIVHKIDSRARLMLIGDGELRNEIDQKIKDLKLKDFVIFTGMITNAYEYYNAFDVFVLPSFFEGFPVVGIEAQAAGLPIIVSDAVTQEMKLTNNVKYLSLSDSNEIWAEEILQYRNKLNRDNTISQMQKANMDIDHEAIKLLDLYRSLME